MTKKRMDDLLDKGLTEGLSVNEYGELRELSLVDFGVCHPVRLGDIFFSDDNPDSVSRTRQEFAPECDINTIMERYEATGVVSHVNRAEPMYLDTTIYPDLQGAMDKFREASVAFNSLPAKVRKEFDNDPQKFIDFASDPDAKHDGHEKTNLERMREWGLAEPVKAPERPIQVEVINSPGSGEPAPAGAGGNKAE